MAPLSRFAPSPRGGTMSVASVRPLLAVSDLGCVGFLSRPPVFAVMSWRGLDGMIRTQESTRTQGEQQAVLQTVLAQWNADLNALMPLAGRQALEWDGQVFRMTRKSSGPVDNGAWVVAWSRRNVDGQFQWVRWQSLPLRTASEWNDAWIQAAQWGRYPSVARVLLPQQCLDQPAIERRQQIR